MLTAVKPALAPQPLRVLLVGDQEEDFFLIREILERTRNLLAAELDHARTIEEAREMLRRSLYGLVLFEHGTQDAEAIQLASEFSQYWGYPYRLFCLPKMPTKTPLRRSSDRAHGTASPSLNWTATRSSAPSATLLHSILCRWSSDPQKNLCGSSRAWSNSSRLRHYYGPQRNHRIREPRIRNTDWLQR